MAKKRIRDQRSSQSIFIFPISLTDTKTDEVYAQITLQPVNKYGREELLASDMGLKLNRQPTEFFCKTLTASDTSTHGGFSVPRRAAEKIFPPLFFVVMLLMDGTLINSIKVIIESLMEFSPFSLLLALSIFGWSIKQIINVIEMKTAADVCVLYDIEKEHKH